MCAMLLDYVYIHKLTYKLLTSLYYIIFGKITKLTNKLTSYKELEITY